MRQNHTRSALRILAAGCLALGVGGGLVACSGGSDTPEETQQPKVDAKPERPEGPLPALLVVQAHFEMQGKKPVPQPAKLVVWRTDGEHWWKEVILDPSSNVFHKAMPFEDGILTIAGEKALVKLWKPEGGSWKSETLREREWGGKFNRFRDVELGDVNGDEQDELVLATHDQGVVSVGTNKDGSWEFVELDQEADTFVHEIEIGDVDGDGKQEFYATPSDRNRVSGESQPGMVVRYDFTGEGYERSEVASWEESHAKEILVTDVDGDGTDELFLVREGHTADKDGKVELIDPVRILLATKTEAGWETCTAATLDDHQTRFVTAGDVDGDGKNELVAAGYKSGLWMLEPTESDECGMSFDKVLIDAKSGGFEHATHLADLDGDGKLEIYAASDKDKQLRVYTWNGKGFSRDVVWDMPDHHLTWNIQDAKL